MSTIGNGGQVLIQGNWTGSADNPQAIYIDKEDAKLTLEARGKGKITLSGVAMSIFDEVAGGAPSDHSYIFQIIKGAVDGNLQLAFENELKAVAYATAHMTSDDILAAYFQLYTKDSPNDSVEIVGWRDNLAAWAELEVDQAEGKSFTISDKGKITGDIIQTEIYITGAISNQNIIHEATTSSWNSADDYTYSTATHLQATEASLSRQS